ncbi:hypothetical protein [Sphingomonas jatrophae]|nr:hypothetical protein [Sphingomonas jatrophae]
MNDERIIVAVGRLERALARAEAAAARPPSAPVADPDEELRARHQRLRDSTQAAIARLDTLLGPAVDPALEVSPAPEEPR